MNLLEKASRMKDRDKAMRMLSKALSVTWDARTPYLFESETWWKRVQPWSRLTEISGWLKGQCVLAMNLEEGNRPRVSKGGRGND